MEPISTAGQFLAQHNGGASDVELTKALAEALERAQVTGKVCSVTWTVRVEPAGQGFEVVDKVAAKLADLPRDGIVYWPSVGDALFAFDPPGQAPLPEAGEHPAGSPRLRAVLNGGEL